MCNVAWPQASELKRFKEAVLERFNAQDTESNDAVRKECLCYLSAARLARRNTVPYGPSGPAVLLFVVGTPHIAAVTPCMTTEMAGVYP